MFNLHSNLIETNTIHYLRNELIKSETKKTLYNTFIINLALFFGFFFILFTVLYLKRKVRFEKSQVPSSKETLIDRVVKKNSTNPAVNPGMITKLPLFETVL